MLHRNFLAMLSAATLGFSATPVLTVLAQPSVSSELALLSPNVIVVPPKQLLSETIEVAPLNVSRAPLPHTIVAAPAPLQPNTAIREIVSMKRKYSAGEIVISTDARKLYYVTSRGVGLAYPIAVPGAHGDKYYGRTRITKKRPSPVWIPAKETRDRIQLQSGKVLPKAVLPGDPVNALGEYALNLTWPLIRIHGTNNPSEIGSATSAGCFRMYNAHVTELASLVQVGTPVTVVK